MGDLLELLYYARKSFITLQATVRVWWDVERQEEAWRRYQASQPAGSVASLGPRTRPASGQAERFLRLWLQPPSRRRYEAYRTGSAIRTMSVANGDRWWTYNPQPPPQLPAVVTNVRPDQTVVVRPEYIRHSQGDETAQVVDPSQLIPKFSLEPSGRATHAGREAIRVKAWPRDDNDPREMLWFGADEYEFLVDAERGTMLRALAWMDGRELALKEITSVVFDEAIPEEMFEFTPPAGVKVQVIGSVIP